MSLYLFKYCLTSDLSGIKYFYLLMDVGPSHSNKNVKEPWNSLKRKS